MSNELTVITPKSIEEAERMSKTLSASQLLPDALRQKPADVLATVLAGAELGLAPMQAIRGIVIIKGKPTLAADTMGALVKRRSDVCEYLVLKESSSEKATYETKRKGDPAPTSMAFTIQDAQRAGLNGDNWRKYPQAMLRARCLSAICRAVYPDLCLGLYDPDELAAEAPSAPQPPPEKDVTPSIPRNAIEAKAALQAKVAATVTKLESAVEGQVVKPRMTIKDEATPSPWERIKKAGLAADMTPDNITKESLRIAKKTKRAELTDEDADAFASWLNDEPPMTQAPLAHVEEAAPF